MLEFSLPEEQEQFRQAQDAWKFETIINDVFNWLRRIEKDHNTYEISTDDMRKKLVELQKEYFE